MSWEKLDRKKENKKELRRLAKTFLDLEGRQALIAKDLCEELSSLKVEMKILKVECRILCGVIGVAYSLVTMFSC